MAILKTSLLAAALTTALAAPALAQDTNAQKSPEEVNQEILQSTKTAPDGTVQPTTGRAEPVENWFGCKPGNDKEECEAENKQAATEDKQSRTANTPTTSDEKPGTSGDQAGKSAEEVNQEVIEAAKTAPDGTVQPETGRAKPVENWFGCKPGNDKKECEAQNPQAEAGTESAAEDKTTGTNTARQ